MGLFCLKKNTSRSLLPTLGILAVLHLIPAGAIADGAGNSPKQAQHLLSKHFNQAEEFPNLFLPKEYRGLAPDQIPASVIEESQKTLEQALGSVFDRLVVPIVHPGESSPKLTRYFPFLLEKLSKKDPGVKLYASGGVVRSAITYLYDEVYKGLRTNPGGDSLEILRRIARATDDIPAGHVRGIGSDFDLLIQSPAGKGADLQKYADEVTNSAANTFGSQMKGGGLKNSLFTMGDVRDYDTQIQRSTRQGGSTIDYLGFDVAKKSLRNPPRFPEISRDLIKGLYEFAGPESAEFIEDLADTVIRGYRTLLETPWLKMKDENHFREGIAQLKRDQAQGKEFSKRAKGQFAKGMRNSRYFGAHNRFHRAKPGSIEAEVLDLARTLGAKDKVNYLAEFADALPIDKRSGNHAELRGLPAELLENPKEFLRTNTRNGKVFHGTPSIENALAIMRQGLFLSKAGQGTAVFGRGVYTSPQLELAKSHAQSGGLVFELAIKNDPRVNILDWEKHSSHPDLIKIAAEAKVAGRDIFEYLSREHGIDIIKNGHVLVQNSEALEFPKGLQGILSSMVQQFRGKSAFSSDDLQGYIEFRRIHDYARQLGEAPALTGEEQLRLDRLYVPQALADVRSNVRADGARLISLLPPEKQFSALSTALRSTDGEVRTAAFETDWSAIPFSQREDLLKEGLLDIYLPHKSAAKQFRLLPGELRRQIAASISMEKTNGHFPSAFVYAHYIEGDGPPSEFADWIKQGLMDSYLVQRRSAASFIGNAPANQQAMLLTEVLKDWHHDVQLAGMQAADWKVIPDSDKFALIRIVYDSIEKVGKFAIEQFQLLSGDLQRQFVASISKNKAKDFLPKNFINAYYRDGKGPPSELVEWIKHGLNNSQWDNRQWAASLIGKAPPEHQVSLLANAMSDRYFDVRSAAMDGLNLKTLEPATRTQIVSTLSRSQYSEVRKFAATQFSQLPGPSRDQVLSDILKSLELEKSGAFPSEIFFSHMNSGRALPGSLSNWIDYGLTTAEPDSRKLLLKMLDMDLPVSQQLLKKAIQGQDSKVATAAVEILVDSVNRKTGQTAELAREIVNDSRSPSAVRKQLISRLPSLDLKYRSACGLKIRSLMNSVFGI